MRRPALSLALCACVVALAAVPASASATTYVLRPSSTQTSSAAWQPTPAGSTLDAALANPALQPDTPATTQYATVTGTSFFSQALELGLPAVALAPGETVSSATLWVYTSVGANQVLQPGVNAGGKLLKSTWIGPSPAGWHQVSVPLPLSAAQLAGLSIEITSCDGYWCGSSGDSAKVYAAYLEIDTTSAPASSTPSTPAGTPQPPADTPGASPSVPAPVAPVVVVAAAPVIAQAASTVDVPLSCPGGRDAAACRGVVALRVLAILGRPAVRHRPARVRARRHPGIHGTHRRCARGCRPIVSETRFALRAGRRGRIRLHLFKAVRDALRQGRQVRALLTVTTQVAGGSSTTTSKVIVLGRRR